MTALFLRNLARRSRRYRHQCRVQVTWRIPAGLCWWLWQSALVLLPLLSAKGQSCSLTLKLRRSVSVSEFLFSSVSEKMLTISTPRAEQQMSVLMKATHNKRLTSTCLMWTISARCLFCAARLLFNKLKCWVQTTRWIQLAVQAGWIPSFFKPIFTDVLWLHHSLRMLSLFKQLNIMWWN